jgi:hypothetical protein
MSFVESKRARLLLSRTRVVAHGARLGNVPARRPPARRPDRASLPHILEEGSMKRLTRTVAATIAAFALPMLAGCLSSDESRIESSSAAYQDQAPAPPVPPGTPLTVRLTARLTSETVRAGDAWSGTLANAVTVGDREVIPAGSDVRGIVTGAQPAAPGTRAMIDLEVRTVSIDDQARPLAAGVEAIQAELPEARPGDAAAARGSQVVLEHGSELVFSVQSPATVSGP